MDNKDTIIEPNKETTLFDEVFTNLLAAYTGARHFDIDIKTETLIDMAKYLCKKFEDKYYEGYHEGYSVGYYYGKQDAHSADRAEPTNNNNKIKMDCDNQVKGDNMENDRLKGLVDDGTPLTKAILKIAEDYARGYQPPSNAVAKGWQEKSIYENMININENNIANG